MSQDGPIVHNQDKLGPNIEKREGKRRFYPKNREHMFKGCHSTIRSVVSLGESVTLLYRALHSAARGFITTKLGYNVS